MTYHHLFLLRFSSSGLDCHRPLGKAHYLNNGLVTVERAKRAPDTDNCDLEKLRVVCGDGGGGGGGGGGRLHPEVTPRVTDFRVTVVTYSRTFIL